MTWPPPSGRTAISREGRALRRINGRGTHSVSLLAGAGPRLGAGSLRLWPVATDIRSRELDMRGQAARSEWCIATW
jgi:hypothetical protein